MDDKRLYLMGQEKVGKALRIMAIPAIIGMMVNSVYNIVDALYVGWLGKEQLGATGIAMPIFMLIGAFGITIGMGANSYISRLLGAKDIDQAEKTAGFALLLALVTGILLTAAGQIWLVPILKLFGATPGILPYAVDYTRIIFWSGAITVCNMVFNNILRAEGSATPSMIGMSLGAVLNIVLDPIFIFVLDMGIKGAAWATLLSNFSSFLFLMGYVFMGKGVLKPKPWKVSFSGRIYGEIMKIGTPSLFRQLLVSLSVGFLNNAAGSFSDAAVAAVAVVGRVTSFGYMGLLGLNQGFLPLAGFNYGAGQYRRLRQTIAATVKAGSVFSLLIAVAGLALAPQIAQAFGSDAEVIDITARGLRYASILFPFTGFMITFNVLFQAMGKALPAAFLSLARQGIFYIPMILILPHFMGLTGVLLSQTFADGLTLLTTAAFAIYIMRWINARIEESVPSALAAE